MYIYNEGGITILIDFQRPTGHKLIVNVAPAYYIGGGIDLRRLYCPSWCPLLEAARRSEFCAFSPVVEHANPRWFSGWRKMCVDWHLFPWKVPFLALFLPCCDPCFGPLFLPGCSKFCIISKILLRARRKLSGASVSVTLFCGVRRPYSWAPWILGRMRLVSHRHRFWLGMQFGL